MTVCETAVPPIRGPASLRPISPSWDTFSKAPKSCRETVATSNLTQMNGCQPLYLGIATLDLPNLS